MENIKQKIVLPTRGVCNTTPDPICEDNELEDCVGFSYSDEAVRPIQDVKPLLSIGEGTLMYVHRLNDGQTVNYIATTGTDIRWGEDGILQIGADIKGVKSIGNTLIVNTASGIFYLLWNDGGYENLGNSMEETELYFNLSCTYGSVSWDVYRYFSRMPCGDVIGHSGNHLEISSNNIDAAYDLAASLYLANKKWVAEHKKFRAPFFVCYAYELYDKTFAKVSNPILMLPSYYDNDFFTYDSGLLICSTFCSKLQYQIKSIIPAKWRDIVKNISVFVSSEIELFDSSYKPTPQGSSLTIYGDTHRFHEGIENSVYHKENLEDNVYVYSFFEAREKSGIINDLVHSSQFYKIAEIDPYETLDFYKTKSWTDVNIPYKSTLATLETQPRLENLDFYSHCSYTPDGMETFNRRLNIYGVQRTFFEGFKSFVPIRKESVDFLDHHYTVDVTIKINGAENHVISGMHTRDIFFDGQCWFYYPDPRATHVVITRKNGDTILDEDLKEHSGLNGAYYLASDNKGPFPQFSTKPDDTSCDDEDEFVSLPEPEYLDNYLLQSEVDNPFVINASGYVHVGQGKILGLAALTTALSQDAYKVATTIAFTTQGIWALSINDEGAYNTVPPPFSREVCSNPKSITMVDNGIYYVSKRGLMVISDNANGCVTTQICGKNHKEYDSFTEFIQNCTCAYDYRDSQLWLVNPDYDFHWVYSIKSGTLSRKEDGHSYEAVVSDYPDTLLQAGGSLFSMYQEPNINDDETLYSGFFITRPMKFEQAMALKSLRDLKHIKDVSPEAEIVLTIYASNDCTSWQQLSSLKGRGFKYFKFRYDLTNLKAADAFCGTVLYYTTRLTDRIR